MKLLLLIYLFYFAPREVQPTFREGTAVAKKTFQSAIKEDAPVSRKFVQASKRIVKRKALSSVLSVATQAVKKIAVSAEVLSFTTSAQFSHLSTEGHERAPPVLHA